MTGAIGWKLHRTDVPEQFQVYSFELHGVPGVTVLMEVDYKAGGAVLLLAAALGDLLSLLGKPRAGDPLPSVTPRPGRTRQVRVRRARSPNKL